MTKIQFNYLKLYRSLLYKRWKETYLSGRTVEAKNIAKLHDCVNNVLIEVKHK